MMIRLAAAAAVGLSFLFLAACKQGQDEGNTDDTRLDEDRFLQMQFDIVTKDERALTITALGYCNTLADLDIDDYKVECPAKIAHKRDVITKAYTCFEGSIPAASSDVRNHEGRPRGDDFCRDTYPEQYAAFPEDVMRRTTDLMYESDIYTVTDITPKP